MKERLMGVINYIMGIVGGLAVIVFAFCPLITYTSDLLAYPGEVTYNGFQLLNVNFEFFNFTAVALLAGIFAIIAVVLAVVLIVVSIMMILKKCEVYDWKLDNKISDFSLIYDAFASIFAVIAFGVFLCATLFKSANADLSNFFMNTTVFAILLFAIPAGLCIIMWVIDTMKETKAKKVEAPKAE
ncbi:MAG: hypothetical protein PHE93_01980 [Clostridia bacterium]|nr:hypothetical protein [Clostridia bacterium]